MTKRNFTVPVAIVTAAMLFSGQAFAKSWTEVQNGTTYNCEDIQSEQCKADSKGNLYDCHTVKKTKCVAVAGPGSGKPAALSSGDGDTSPPKPPKHFWTFGKTATSFSVGG